MPPTKAETDIRAALAESQQGESEPVMCRDCEGSGEYGDGVSVCPTCNGTGDERLGAGLKRLLSDALEDQGSGPVGGGGDGRGKPSTADAAAGSAMAPEQPKAAHGAGAEPQQVDDLPAPTADKCPNPDCEDGQIHMYADQIIDCPTCHGTGEKP
jgi:hypothetical protein